MLCARSGARDLAQADLISVDGCTCTRAGVVVPARVFFAESFHRLASGGARVAGVDASVGCG